MKIILREGAIKLTINIIIMDCYSVTSLASVYQLLESLLLEDKHITQQLG